jgi:hypothetical protein
VAERIVIRSVMRQIEKEEELARADADKPRTLLPRGLRAG